ncbi:hypothetical protein NW762_005737 [Fusarium torreyae]|uniref:Arginine metabolism regulation protein II n=1 Tax=Fusarium torreyae TaxID=1237075 RepID=A0A9W8S3D3_9HYPO|nr:hypothetical protein NW762_005737 [Fusarium torreyae]
MSSVTKPVRAVEHVEPLALTAMGTSKLAYSGWTGQKMTPLTATILSRGFQAFLTLLFSSSAELISSLSHRSIDGSLADVDHQSKQSPEARNGISVGPFGAFSVCEQTPASSTHETPSITTQEEIVVSEIALDLSEHDAIDQHQSQDLEPLLDLDLWPSSENFLDWQDIFDLGSSNALPPTLGLDFDQVLQLPLSETTSFQHEPPQASIVESQQPHQEQSQLPNFSSLLSTAEAQSLLEHYHTKVITHIWSFPLGRKSSMDIHFDAAILYNRQADARAHLLESERLLKTFGLAKDSISRKATYLHHTYTWARIVGESTYVSGRRSPDPGYREPQQHVGIRDEATASRPLDGITNIHNSVPRLRLDDFLGLKPTNPEVIAASPTDQIQSPLENMHLENIRGKSDPSLRFLYGVSEAWLSLVSQTTRLANQIEKPNTPVDSHSASASGPLARRKRHLENHIWLHVTDSLRAAEARSGAEDCSPCSSRTCLVRALDCSLVIFFYRRILNSHPRLLQIYVGYVIRALRDFDSACEKEGVDSPGSPWPAFIAGCEALEPSHRAYFVDWLEKSFDKTGFTRYKTAVSCIHETWSRYDNAKGDGGIGCTWMQVCRDKDLYVILC